MSSIRDSIEKWGIGAKAGTENSPFVSRAYRKFFEGYEEDYVQGKNGRLHIRRRYVYDWYIQDMPNSKRRMMKLLLLLLGAAALILFVLPALNPGAVNRAWYVALPQAVSVVLFLWFGYTQMPYITSGKRMTVYAWKRSSGMLPGLSAALTGTLSACGLMTGVYCLLHISEVSAGNMVNTFLYLAAAGCVFAIRRIGSSIPFRTSTE